MKHLASFALLLALALLGSACGKKNGKLMVDSPIYEYQPPAEAQGDDDATAGDDDDDSGDDDSGDDGASE